MIGSLIGGRYRVLEMAGSGAQVMQGRSVEVGKKFSVDIVGRVTEHLASTHLRVA